MIPFTFSGKDLQILPCVVFFAPVGDFEQRSEAMLAIAHRSGRLPVTLMPGNTSISPGFPAFQALAWSCADGVIEQIAIAGEHPDLSALWTQIKGLGLLVSEFMDTRAEDEDGRDSLMEMAPVGYWILNQKGSRGWFSQSN